MGCEVVRQCSGYTISRTDNYEKYIVNFPRRTAGVRWLGPFTTIEEATAGAESALKQHRKHAAQREVLRRNAAAAAASAELEAKKTQDKESHQDEDIRLELEVAELLVELGQQAPSALPQLPDEASVRTAAATPDSNTLSVSPQPIMLQCQTPVGSLQLQGSEQNAGECDDGMGPEEDELLLTSLTGNLSAGQQLQLQKQVQQLQMKLQLNEQLATQEMQQVKQLLKQAVQQVSQQRQARLELQQELQLKVQRHEQMEQQARQFCEQAMQQVSQQRQARLELQQELQLKVQRHEQMEQQARQFCEQAMQEVSQQRQARLELDQELQQLRQQNEQLQAHLQMQRGRQPALDQSPGQQQQPPPVAAFAAAATLAGVAVSSKHDSISRVVQLTEIYNSELPQGVYVRMGQPLASGATAAVFVGNLVVSSNGVETVLGQAAVKTFDAAAIRAHPHKLLHLAKQELTALQLLQGHPAVVKLVAQGVVKTSTAVGAYSSAAAAAAPAPAPAAAAPPQVYCILEELAVCSVSHRLRNLGPMPEQEVQQHTYSLMCLLQYMHSGKIQLKSKPNSSQPGAFVTMVHRDIKPDNLLIRSNGSIVLADFGMCSIQQQLGCSAAGAATGAAPAGLLDGSGAMHTLLGTPHYMTPELTAAVLAGYAQEVACRNRCSTAHGAHAAAADTTNTAADRFCYDASVDTYALGVTAMEMLVGKLQYINADVGLYEGVQQQDERLAAFANGDAATLQRLLPQAVGMQVSQAAREFVGCCCGVGAARDAAAAAGQVRRLSAAQLLLLPWMQQVAGPGV